MPKPTNSLTIQFEKVNSSVVKISYNGHVQWFDLSNGIFISNFLKDLAKLPRSKKISITFKSLKA